MLSTQSTLEAYSAAPPRTLPSSPPTFSPKKNTFLFYGQQLKYEPLSRDHKYLSFPEISWNIFLWRVYRNRLTIGIAFNLRVMLESLRVQKIWGLNFYVVFFGGLNACFKLNWMTAITRRGFMELIVLRNTCKEYFRYPIIAPEDIFSSPGEKCRKLIIT